jgi:hypothetical protein
MWATPGHSLHTRQRLLAMKQNTVMRHIGLESRAQLASLAKFSTAKEAAVQDGFFLFFL